MKTLLLLLAGCFSLSTFSQARSKEELKAEKSNSFKQNRLSFNVGLSSPSGEFASTDATNIEAGFATGGLIVKLNYAYLFTENIGVTFDFTNASFDVESSELNSLVQASYIGLAKNINYNVGNYNLSQFTFGIMVQTGGTSKIYINPVVGYSSFSFPTQSVRGTTIQNSQGVPADIDFQTTTLGPNSNEAFYAINGGLDAPLSESVWLNVNVQYFSLDFPFKGSINYSDSQNNRSSNQYRYTQPVSALILSLGISHYF